VDYFPGKTKKTTKIVRVAIVPAKNRIEHLPNTVMDFLCLWRRTYCGL
jgi:hypothetical protein